MWYSQGTVTATNNSTTITGAGTQFIANVRVGDGITIQGSSSLHEVVGIASNTQMTINPAFLGTTGGGKQYACAPILGYDKDLSDSFNQLRLQFGDKLSSLQPWAYAATAGAALDSLGFSASGKDIASGDIITQADAETGTSTVAKAFTAQRVRQAIVAWFNGISGAIGRTILGRNTAAQVRSDLGLGTASTANVTTSRTDTTSGRVMRVGDGGVLSEVAPAVPSNTLENRFPSGLYRGVSDMLGAPSTVNDLAVLSINTASNDRVFRLISTTHRDSALWWQIGSTEGLTTHTILHTGNILQTTGQSTEFPMSQKAVTDALNAYTEQGTAFGRGFISLEDAADGRSKLELGTASTANVTTSSTDTTSGRVMRVGDGGWMGRAGNDGIPAGYPSTLASSYTTVYRRNEVDNGVSAYAPSFRFAAVDTWGAIRVGFSSAGAWLQGGRADTGTGWTSQVVLSANLHQGTGQATVMPMSQKATTDAINGVSDSRDKVDIQPTDVGLNLIEQLNPVSFRLNKRDWYRADEAKKFETITDEEGNETEQTTICQETLKKPLSEYADNDASLAREDVYTGLIAQEVKEAYESLGLDMAVVKNMADEYEGGEDRFYIEYNGLIPVLINAIKELSDRVKHLESVSLENTTGVVDENV